MAKDGVVIFNLNCDFRLIKKMKDIVVKIHILMQTLCRLPCLSFAALRLASVLRNFLLSFGRLCCCSILRGYTPSLVLRAGLWSGRFKRFLSPESLSFLEGSPFLEKSLSGASRGLDANSKHGVADAIIIAVADSVDASYP